MGFYMILITQGKYPLLWEVSLIWVAPELKNRANNRWLYKIIQRILFYIAFKASCIVYLNDLRMVWNKNKREENFLSAFI